MPYINNKYTSRAISGTGKFKIGEIVVCQHRFPNKWQDGKKLQGKKGTIVEDMFVGIYDYLVKVGRQEYYFYESDLRPATNIFKIIKEKYLK